MMGNHRKAHPMQWDSTGIEAKLTESGLKRSAFAEKANGEAAANLAIGCYFFDTSVRQ
jgi:hypothetical protein